MKFKSLVFGAMAAALILALGSTTAVAQDNIFALSYFSNAHLGRVLSWSNLARPPLRTLEELKPAT